MIDSRQPAGASADADWGEMGTAMANGNPEILPSLPVHGGAPSDTSEHRLRVDGLVRDDTILDSAALTALPRAEVTEDFICREGWAVSGLHWEGVSLSTVLELVGASPEAAFVQVSSGDFSTPLSRADASRALLATDLGGEPLGAQHGGPVRLILPGADCYTSVKWVDHIEVRRSPSDDTAQTIALARLERRADA